MLIASKTKGDYIVDITDSTSIKKCLKLLVK